MHNLPPLPESFINILAETVTAARLQDVMASFIKQKPTSFRINPLKGDPAMTYHELVQAGFRLTEVPWYEYAHVIDIEQKRALTESLPFREGRIYIQSLSSMLAPLILAPQPGETVLDLAAAPGGKTLLMAAMMEDKGRLSAVEAVKGRFFKLRANLEAAGTQIVKTYLMDGRDVGRKCREMFDKVLLDAPCSSEARFTRLDPESWEHWSMRKVDEAARKQRGLIKSAVESLKPNGTLVYCTCSFSPEENELVVNDLLRRAKSDLQLLPISLPIENVEPGLTQWKGKSLHPDLNLSARILPNDKMDGFYICMIRKLP